MENEEARAARTSGGDLTHISQILLNTRSNELSQEKTLTKKIEPCECMYCKETFQGEVLYYPGQKPRRPTECPKCRAGREAEEARLEEEELEKKRAFMRDAWRRGCGMPALLLARTFDNFERKYQKEAYRAALEWARSFDLDEPRQSPSLIFYSGVPGVGKGHLMSAIVNLVIDSWKGRPEPARRCPIRFESGPGLVRRIRATYNLSRDDYGHEREDEVYAKLSGVALLLLDDVGKEAPSNFTRETYWYIIDERVKNGLPVIMSSRLPFEGEHCLMELMGEDTVSRLYGMTHGEVIEMTGQDYRKLKAIA